MMVGLPEPKFNMLRYLKSYEFYRYCLAVRLALQRVKNAPYDNADLTGACGDAALIITKHIKRYGNAQTIGGFYGRMDSHCWTRVKTSRGAYIVDVTATQFGRHIPPVVLLPETSSRRLYRCSNTQRQHEDCDVSVGSLTASQRRGVLKRIHLEMPYV